MESKRSNLRFTLTVSLALASIGTTSALLMNRAQTAQAQEQPELPIEPPAEPIEPLPPPDFGPIQMPEDFESLELPERGTDTRPATAPATAPTTAPAAVEAPPEPVRPNSPPPRGTRVTHRTGRVTTSSPASAPVEAATTQPANQLAPSQETRAATSQPGAIRVGNGHGGIILNFQNASVEAVLDELSAVAGFKVVKEVARMEGKVTLISKQPLSPTEVLSVLDTELRKNNYAAVRYGDVLKVMEISRARKSAIPVHTGNDPTQIEPSDQLITQVIPIRNAEALQLKEDLGPLINAQESDFSANASSNSLILTDTSANIRRVVEIVSALDQHMSASVDYRVFKLKFASASSTAKLITDLFAPAQQGQSQQQPSFPFGFSFRGGSDRDRERDRERNRGNSNAGESRTQGKVTVSPDDRTNTLVVTGPPDTLDVVGTIITELDSDPSDDQSVFVYNLRNAQAAQIELVVNSLFNGSGGIGAGLSRNQIGRGGALSTGGTNRSNNSGRSSSFGGGSSGFGGTGSSFGSNRSLLSGGSSSFGGFGGFSSANLSQAASRTAASLAGQVTVVADADTNSILVMTSPKNFERVKQVVEELDRPVPQVLIKVLIAEVTHDNALDIGTEFSAINLSAAGRGATAATDFGLANVTSGLVVKVLGNDVSATLHLLERNGKLDVLSRPYILGSDNQLATIEVGQLVPFPTDNRISDQLTTSTSIRYDSVGIILDVVPHINPDGLVIMDVQPTISALTSSSVQISDTFSAPIVNNRSAQSRVAIENGKTIVIGGLMEDRLTQTIRKVPLLGDIPFVGAAFQRLEKTKIKTELLIFLTPHVAASPASLPKMSQDEINGTKILPNSVEPGDYQSHREGLNRGANPIVPRGGARFERSTTQPVEPEPAHAVSPDQSMEQPEHE